MRLRSDPGNPPQTLCVEYVGVTAFDGTTPSDTFERPIRAPNAENIIEIDQAGPLGLLDPDGGTGGSRGDRFIQWLEIVLDDPADLTVNIVDGQNPTAVLANVVPTQAVADVLFHGTQFRVPQGALLQIVTSPEVGGRVRLRPTLEAQCCVADVEDGGDPVASTQHGSIGYGARVETQVGSAGAFVNVQGPGVLDAPVGFTSVSPNALTYTGVPATFFVIAELNPNNGNIEESGYQIRLTVNDVPVTSSTVFLVIGETHRVMACTRAQISLSTGDVVRCQVFAPDGGVDTSLTYFRLQAHYVGPFVEPPPVTSIAFTMPGSDLFPLDLFHLRRGLVGGTLARNWVSWTEGGGGLRVLDFAQGGSSADPTVFVPALAAAARTTVDLGNVSRTADEVATLIIAALALDGISASAVGGTVEVEDASDLVIPPDVDMTDTSLRGMWGGQRDNWGAGSGGQTLNQDGGTGGIGSVHLPPLGTSGRIIGMYLWTVEDEAMDVRLAYSSGPGYSVDPGLMTVQAQGQLTAQGFSAISFVAVPVDAADELWAQYRGNNGGGPRFRAQGATPAGTGNLGVGEVLVWDTTTNPDAAVPFGATYDPVANATFPIYIMIGVVFEFPDANGNYYANGRIDLRVGDQNNDPDHGTQVDADAAQLSGENTHQRFQWINWTDLDNLSVTRTVAAIAADEDSRTAIYQWTDLNHPSTTPATLVADMGLMGLTPAGAGAAQTRVLPTPVPMGVAELGSDAIISLGFNYVTTGGTPLAGYVLPVFIEVLGDGAWLTCWEDDRETWHDNIPGASNRAYVSGVQEYRQRNVVGSPFQSTAQTWPDPMVTDPTDDSPPAIALDWILLRREGIQAA